jgi:HEAT repeat protein
MDALASGGHVMDVKIGIDQDLATALGDPDPFVRTLALARSEAPAAEIRTISDALGDDYPMVRREAVRALGRAAGPEAAHALLEAAAHDLSAEVREEAVAALAMLLGAGRDAGAHS